MLTNETDLINVLFFAPAPSSFMPNKKKDFIYSKSSTTKLLQNCHSSVRKQWSDEQMLGTFEICIRRWHLGKQSSSPAWSAPLTLKDHLSGRVTHRSNPHPKPYLNVTKVDN